MGHETTKSASRRTRRLVFKRGPIQPKESLTLLLESFFTTPKGEGLRSSPERMDAQSIQSEILKGKTEAVEATTMELAQTKEELDRAREIAMQSWLDSKPLIDELEKLQSALTKAKNRVSMATVTISTIESQLKATNTSIKSKEDEEFKAKMTINEIGRILDKTQSEMAELKSETGKARRARAKLKQELRFKRQSLRTLQLIQRAVGMETEAFSASAAAALHHIKQSQTETELVELSHKAHSILIARADEEAALADWRVSVSMEQRQLAEAGKEEAVKRLGMLYSENQSRKRRMQVDTITEEGEMIEKASKEEIGSSRIPGNAIVKHSTSLQDRHTQAKANEKFVTNKGDPQQMMKRSKSGSYKFRKIAKTKKPSILHQIRNFLVRNLRRVFR